MSKPPPPAQPLEDAEGSEEPTYALLLDEPVFLLQRRLVRRVGLVGAIFLQQLHYWHLKMGREWVYNDYKAWLEQLPLDCSESTLERAVLKLEALTVEMDDGSTQPLLESRPACQVFHSLPLDRRKCYRLNYDALERLAEASAWAVTVARPDWWTVRTPQNEAFDEGGGEGAPEAAAPTFPKPAGQQNGAFERSKMPPRTQQSGGSESTRLELPMEHETPPETPPGEQPQESTQAHPPRILVKAGAHEPARAGAAAEAPGDTSWEKRVDDGLQAIGEFFKGAPFNGSRGVPVIQPTPPPVRAANPAPPRPAEDPAAVQLKRRLAGFAVTSASERALLAARAVGVDAEPCRLLLEVRGEGPASALRDLHVPRALKRAREHEDFPDVQVRVMGEG